MALVTSSQWDQLDYVLTTTYNNFHANNLFLNKSFFNENDLTGETEKITRMHNSVAVPSLLLFTFPCDASYPGCQRSSRSPAARSFFSPPRRSILSPPTSGTQGSRILYPLIQLSTTSSPPLCCCPRVLPQPTDPIHHLIAKFLTH